MDLTKVETIQELLNLTTEYINELVLDSDLSELDAIDMFQIAVQNALLHYQNSTVKKQKHSPIGKVDTKSVAFSLQDKDTMAILQGPADFLDDTDFDTLGGDEE